MPAFNVFLADKVCLRACVHVCGLVGAMAEGAEGFFKGVGKGLLGVVVRPVGGVLDFAGSTFEGIKK